MNECEPGRYERKYLIPEHVATAARRFVAAYLPADDHMAGQQRWGYRVHSLYLDSPQFALYRESTDGTKNRFKLRIRFYDPAEDAAAFLEIKRRIGTTIHKQRAMVPKPAAERLLKGGMITARDILNYDEKSARALGEFCHLREQIGAAGTAFVSYWRDAFVSRQAEAARVTFDREIVGHLYHPRDGLTIVERPAQVTSDQVVLELKYIGRAPSWMQDLIKMFQLERISYPKYVHCVDALKMTAALAG